MGIPVIFIHQGNSRYLFNTFHQLRKTNPGSVLYLIGTKESKVYEPFVKHVDIANYFSEATKFEKLYQHYSTNSYEFELICLQRWFILKEFLLANKIHECLYLDSDVLVYSDLTELFGKIGKYGMTITGFSGHSNFLRLDTLADFCKYVTSGYSDKDVMHDLSEQYNAYVAEHGVGCISDMNFLTNYQAKYPDKVLNLKYYTETEVFDTALAEGDRYVMNGEIKKVVIENSKPYCITKDDHLPVLHHTLHFQGTYCKKIMQNYVIKKSISFYFYKLYYDVIFFSQKVKRKFFI